MLPKMMPACAKKKKKTGKDKKSRMSCRSSRARPHAGECTGSTAAASSAEAYLSAADFDVGADGAARIPAKRVGLWTLGQTQVAQRGELQLHVLQRVARLVDDQHVEHHVVSVVGPVGV
jgi:hypothetical protein